MDEPAEQVGAHDGRRGRGWIAGNDPNADGVRRLQVERALRPVSVVVADVDAENMLKPETAEERRRYEAAKLRRERRLAERMSEEKWRK